ncbi:MAG: phosphoglycerate kinase [Patescibacteria group bacterium]
MKTLKEFNFQNKRVLVRCDFNIPQDSEGNILDDFRIKQTLPTIEYLIKERAEVILMSHLGNPGGKFVKGLQMTPIAERLAELLGRKLALLDNLRFNPGEESNDDNFAKDLAKNGDIYVNEAFSVCHRKHASVVAITRYLPSCAGFLLEKETSVLSGLMEKPKRPLVAIIGGAKVEKKVKFINKFSEIADFVLIGGLIQKEAKEKNIQFSCPEKIIEPVDEAGEGRDIGSKTIELFVKNILTAKTILWNGPLGEIEKEEFTKGTKAIAQAIVDSGAFSVVGGGETIFLFKKIGIIGKFSHVSTGGGAMLAFLAGEKLPGIEALN